MLKGIRKRWMFNSISAVLFIVLFAVAAFSMAMASYYYSSMSSGLEGKAKSAAVFLTNYKSESEYLQAARSTAETFEESAVLELQFLTPAGSVLYSSSGLTLAGTVPGTDDVQKAVSLESISSWSGKFQRTGERILAVSTPLIYNGTVVGVLRYVTSLRTVDRQIAFTVGVALAVGVGILAIVYFSNLYFVRSIVEPVATITDTAKHIAAGSYGIQMEKQYDDEIGDLTDAINDMSLKINQAEKLKSEFISSVSHELRTPLTAITGWAETIQSGEVRDAEDVKKGMSIIVSEAHRLTNMVEELLEFSRIEDGRFTLSVEPMDIKSELEDAVYTYREFFKREGITLTHTDCPEDIPIMEGDPERLRQVFCNLLDNAAKHGGAGHRIDTAIRKEGDSAVITIRDYGPGIPPAELPHVKYKFYKGSSKARGSGIGLAVCEEIVTRHRGTLTLKNAEGGGLLVSVRLPIKT
ncbi:Adaptive-response sensory-kinase SasA [bioreactor metagenome]|uniref:histidine kinase n=1 Tax=bioreactor metagenome TaxID=1076179 RepID=A0A644WAF0_9ZZZZ